MLKKKWVIFSCNCWNIVILNVDVDKFCISWNFWLSGTMIASLYIHVGHSCCSRKPYQKMYWYIQYLYIIYIYIYTLPTCRHQFACAKHPCQVPFIPNIGALWLVMIKSASSRKPARIWIRCTDGPLTHIRRWLSTQQVIEFMIFRFPKSEIKCLLHMSLSSRHFSF